MDARIEIRRKDFKKTFDDPRRRREEEQVQIRKQNREARITAKRQQALADLDTNDSPSLLYCDIQSIPAIASTLMSSNPEDQFKACQQFRKYLSIEKDPPIQAVVDANVVPRIIEFLKDDTRPELQFEAAWALTNIASGTQAQTRVVIDNGALPVFIKLLSSPKADVREQAIWALGNIAGDCAALRDMVFESGGLPPILEQLTDALKDSSHKVSMLRNASWTLSNLCRAKPKPPLEKLAPAIPILRDLIYSDDHHILIDACWALSYLSDGNENSSNDAIDIILQMGVADQLVMLLNHPRDNVLTPALRTVGNIVSGTESQTQKMIDAKCLPALRNLLNSSRKHIRKETGWTISNITAGSEQQIEAVIKEDIIPLVVQIAGSTPDFYVRREFYWALANAASGASRSQVIYLVQAGIIPALTNALKEGLDPKLVASSLDGFNNILSHGKKMQEETYAEVNPYVQLFEEARGYQILEKLQHEPADSCIYQFTVQIIKAYFAYDEEDAQDFPQYDAFENATNASTAPFGYQNNLES